MYRLFTPGLLVLLLFIKPAFGQPCNGAAWQCLGTQNSTATPLPTGGQYAGGTVVTFCYTMVDYSQCNSNWFHTLDIDLGPGWDVSTFMPISWPASCDGLGIWGYYNSVISSMTGNTYGPCFSYDSPSGSPGLSLDGNPGNNFGDNCTSYTWTFCFSVMVAIGCNGQSLDVNVTACGDGSSGAWTQPTCPGVPLNICTATCLNCELTVAQNVSNPSCLDNDGSITVTPTGGIGDYSFGWTPGGQSDSTVSGLSSGTYIVTISDSLGCLAVDTFDLSYVNPVTFTTVVTDAKCFEYCDGAAFVLPAGGVTPYSYSWLPTGQTTSSDTALCAGTYYITITDSNYCARIDTVIINSPTEIILTPSQQNASCFGSNDGWATVDASGGYGSYYFSWNPTGQNTDTAKNLYAGSYTVTAMDLAGCFADTTITLTSPPQILVAPQIINVSCFGLSDGQISTSISQGVPPYQYYWMQTFETSSAINSLLAGSYSLLVTDANGCTELDTFEVIEPDYLTGTLDVKNASCPAATDGSIAINVSGGTLPYQYLWNNNYSLTGFALSGLTAGSYKVVVIDDHGCTFTASDNITELPDIIADAGADVLLELGKSTLLSVTEDRPGTYYYDWTPGYHLYDSTASSTYAFPYYTTTYVAKVTDVYSGCMAVDTVTVKILPTSYVLLPSAFTPNGDGLNDELFPVMGDLVHLQSFKIFNRWGQVIFSDKTHGWDGMSGGRMEEVGTYVCEATYKIEGGTDQVFSVKGSVTLIR